MIQICEAVGFVRHHHLGLPRRGVYKRLTWSLWRKRSIPYRVRVFVIEGMIEDVRRGLKVKPLNSIHHQSCHILQQVNHYQSIETVIIRIQIAKGTVCQILTFSWTWKCLTFWEVPYANEKPHETVKKGLLVAMKEWLISSFFFVISYLQMWLS